ncbi:MAG: DUF5615 family PIN-like protein [Ignavibacteriae bacterium]|nr:DUF5615 family PIN-like protein [Ignavibacteriota bacterium]
MNISLFLDEDVHAELSIALRKRGFDVLHAQEVERKGKTDDEQLFYAVKEHRSLFSFNVKDFVLLHNNFVRNDTEHFGILLSKQRTFSETFILLLRFLQTHSQGEIKNQIHFL